MNLKNNFIIIIIIAIAIYSVFLFYSDYDTISEKITLFQTEYLFPILLIELSLAAKKFKMEFIITKK